MLATSLLHYNICYIQNISDIANIIADIVRLQASVSSSYDNRPAIMRHFPRHDSLLRGVIEGKMEGKKTTLIKGSSDDQERNRRGRQL